MKLEKNPHYKFETFVWLTFHYIINPTWLKLTVIHENVITGVFKSTNAFCRTDK